ncbi:hypothetical protein ACJ73_05048 [Blastomyces percursus]|uniref:Uncharacterized protein n=1 Tax=Blastomyces percursus TaxID=1658174 RepID=A0A1J9R6H4_9EURO|nr:hypothetical protein ACJ73_05048 [Blastomyces percursus]
MSKNSDTYHWVTEVLERAIKLFDNDSSELLSFQIDAFNSYYDILREDETSLAKRPKQRRNERQRPCHIFASMGAEPFVLFTLAVSRSRLNAAAQKPILLKLRSWWKSTSQPRGLTLVVKNLCEAKSIEPLVSSYRKRKLSETDFKSSTTRKKAPIGELTAPSDRLGNRTLQAPARKHSSNLLANPLPTHALALQIPVPLLPNEDPQSDRMESVFSGNSPPFIKFEFATPELNAKIQFSQDLEFNHLVDFLRQYQNDDRKIRMECPFSGNLLPFIEFEFGTSPRLNAKIEFSQQLGTIFIQYVMSRG